MVIGCACGCKNSCKWNVEISGAFDVVLELVLQLLFPIRDINIRIIIIRAGAADGNSRSELFLKPGIYEMKGQE